MSWWDRIRGRTAQKSLQVNVTPVWPYVGWVWDSYGEMYRKQPNVRTVVGYLARNIAQLNPKIYLRLGDDDRVPDSTHPLALLLQRPNPLTTRYRFIEATVADIGIYDLAFWRKERQDGLVRALVRVPPSRVQLQFDQTTQKTTYRINGETVTRRDLVIFAGYHPDGGEQGVSPLETLRRVLAEEWAAMTARENYWRKGARSAGVIERPLNAPVWSPEARDAFNREWLEENTGILEDGMVFKQGAFSMQDSQYIEGRKLTLDEVARVYAPPLVGLLTPSSQADSFHRQLYQDALAPMLRMIQDEIDTQLLTLDEFDRGNHYCEFNLAEKLRGSFEEQVETFATSIGVPMMSVNEGRARTNMPRIDESWADVPVRPLNVLYGGQASTQMPTADPGTPGMLAYLRRQEKSVLSALGAGKLDWNEARWNRELAEILNEPEAAAFNANMRDQITAAFEAGGLKAVAAVYDGMRLERV